MCCMPSKSRKSSCAHITFSGMQGITPHQCTDAALLSRSAGSRPAPGCAPSTLGARSRWRRASPSPARPAPPCSWCVLHGLEQPQKNSARSQQLLPSCADSSMRSVDCQLMRLYRTACRMLVAWQNPYVDNMISTAVYVYHQLVILSLSVRRRRRCSLATTVWRPTCGLRA